MLMDSQPSLQHAGLHHAIWQLQQEVTRPTAKFKPTSPNKSGVDGGANQVPIYLGQLLHLHSPWWSPWLLFNWIPWSDTICSTTDVNVDVLGCALSQNAAALTQKITIPTTFFEIKASVSQMFLTMRLGCFGGRGLLKGPRQHCIFLIAWTSVIA